MHRVSTGIIGVLCQLDADIPYGPELEVWFTGLAAPKPKTRRRSRAKPKLDAEPSADTPPTLDAEPSTDPAA
jgi:hypothetical protein